MPRDPSSGYPYATGADEPLAHLCLRRARAGAAYLERNKKMAGWWQKIDIHRLNMAHPNADIGGQLMGDYTTFYTELKYSVGEERDLGFAHCMAECPTLEKTIEYYAALTKTWFWVILAELDGGPDFNGVQNPTYVKKMLAKKANP